jgi:hypothetical protein
MNFQLDLNGGAEVLKEIAAAHIAELGNQLAAAAGKDATVELLVTDRAKARVSVPAELQAKDGVLTRAAAELGLEVRPAPVRKRKPRAEGEPARKRTRRRKTAK